MGYKSCDYISFVTTQQIKEERWAVVVINGIQYSYKISDCGRLLSLNTGKILRSSLDKRGYPQNTFYKDSKSTTTRRVHILVASHFVDNPDNLPEVNHIDGNKFNPHYTNLEYNTSKQNKHHAMKLGLCKFPEIRTKKVIDNNTGAVYDSLKKASENVNIGYEYLSLMLCGKATNKTSLSYL